MIQFDDILGQEEAVGFLRRSLVAERLPHGMVFAGRMGVGKFTTATALAGVFLCHKAAINRVGKDRACGKCPSCTLFASGAAGNHPDFHVITKELVRNYDESGKSKATELSVKVIRHALIEPAGRTAGLGHGKFFVVEQAELMTAEAQNALLKTLEEPAGRAAIVLLAESEGMLFPTVRSRCQTLHFGVLDGKVVVTELIKRGVDKQTATAAAEVSGGSIGLAMRWIGDGILPWIARLNEKLDSLLAGRGSGELAELLKAAADGYAEKQLERDPLASKDSATRNGLALYLSLAAKRFSGVLRESQDAGELEQACRAIDAIVQTEMYLDANVTVAVALSQLSLALSRRFHEAGIAARSR
jgi:DNA polymerase III subunit delta'